MRGSDKYFIYAIQHNKTKKIYIGSSNDVERRYRWHMSDLREGKHRSKLMQLEFNEFGEDYSVFILESGNNERILHPYHEYMSISSKVLKEFLWMDEYDSTNSLYGYNSQDRAAKAFINRKRNYENVKLPFVDGKPIKKSGYEIKEK